MQEQRCVYNFGVNGKRNQQNGNEKIEFTFLFPFQTH